MPYARRISPLPSEGPASRAFSIAGASSHFAIGAATRGPKTVRPYAIKAGRQAGFAADAQQMSIAAMRRRHTLNPRLS